jgi:glycosyltransferase involved in cell wall biosynthesis
VNKPLKKVLLVQYSGDYRQAFQRLSRGEGETYYGHAYSLKSLDEVSQLVGEVTVLHCYSQEAYDERLFPKLRVISTGFHWNTPIKKVLQQVELINPDYLVIYTPMIPVLKWAIRNQIKTLVVLADSFNNQSLRQKLFNYRLKKILNSQHICWVANHGLNACYSLKNIGVNPEKIIPWDWPHVQSPTNYSAKCLTAHKDVWDLLYVGAVQKSKGVGDILQALRYLRDKGRSVRLKVAGMGDLQEFKEQAQSLGIQDCVDFLGIVSNQKVIDPLMREADCVIVPSHHNYPEGFPLTLYEALTSRTPIIASDHPMFLGNLQHKINAMFFPARDGQALADSIEELMTDPELYHQISLATEEAWKRLQISTKWGDLLEKWFLDPENCLDYFPSIVSGSWPSD